MKCSILDRPLIAMSRCNALGCSVLGTAAYGGPMLDKKDVQWWIAEVQKHPETATDLVRMLADRLAFLDKQNEQLRGELITLRRKQLGEVVSADITSMQERIQQLEAALRQGKTGQRFLLY